MVTKKSNIKTIEKMEVYFFLIILWNLSVVFSIGDNCTIACKHKKGKSMLFIHSFLSHFYWHAALMTRPGLAAFYV